MIYNPWFDAKEIDVVVVPLGVTGEDYPEVLRPLFRVTNMHGALVTMPNKVTHRPARRRIDRHAPTSPARQCDPEAPGRSLRRRHVRWRRVRARRRRARAGELRGRARSWSAGGVGSAIAASLAAAGVRARPLRRLRRQPRRRYVDGSRRTIPSSNRRPVRRPGRLRHRRQRHSNRNECGDPMP